MADHRGAYEVTAGLDGESVQTRFTGSNVGSVRGLGSADGMNLRLNLTSAADEDEDEYGEVVSSGFVPSGDDRMISPEFGTNSASSPIFLASNGAISPVVLRPGDSKIDAIKKWGISTFKCTKQLLSEKLGKTSRTVDAELEPQIDQIKDTHRRYLNILRLAKAMASHFSGLLATQHAMGEAFADLAQKSPELQDEFLYNADTQRNLTKNGDNLLGALNFFISSLTTLCDKTIEDSLATIRDYEAARVEFDAYRTDAEKLAQDPKNDVAKLQEAQKLSESHRTKYEKLRADVSVKLKFLHENRVKVMHKQLLLFHNSISAYFSGNQSALESTLKQFNIKSPNSGGPSWLEK